jgi:hypothetical protein
MQGCTVARNLPPTMAYGITKEDREIFMRAMVVSTLAPQGSSGKASPGVCSPTAGTCTTNSVASSSSSGGTANAPVSGGDSAINPNGIGGFYIAPVIAPLVVATAPTLTSISFSPLNVVGSLNASGTGPMATFSINSVTFSGITLANTALAATTTSTGSSTIWWNYVSNVSVTYTPFNISGTLSGPSGGTLSGTLSLNTATTPGGQTFNVQGPATLANGILTFNNLSGTFSTAIVGIPSGTVALGTWMPPTTAPVLTTAAAQAETAVRNANLGPLAGTRMGAQRVTLLRR